MKAIIPTLILAAACLAETAVQTDWSGGAGVPGPVPAWDDTYDTCSELNWYVSPGEVYLQMAVSSLRIATGFGAFCSLDAADAEGDGDIDLLSASVNPQELVLLTNNGAVWNETQIEYGGGALQSARFADIDSDGDKDVICSVWDNEYFLRVLRNTPGGWIVEPIGHADCGDLWPADIDGDGDTDFAGKMDWAYLGWWENTDGLGGEWKQHNLISGNPGSTWGVRVTDYDGDADQDIMMLFDYGNHIHLLEQQPGGVFVDHDVSGMLNYVYDAEFGDIDSDGDLDIVGSCWYTYGLFWYELVSPWNWVMHQILPHPDGRVMRMACEDLDLDGDLDIFATMLWGQDRLIWVENVSGDGSSWMEHEIAWCSYGAGLAPGDFDQDGRPDFAVGSSITDDIVIYGFPGYRCNGIMTSSILDTGTWSDWVSIDWTAETPDGTSVSFLVRGSNDPYEMGAWSDTLYTPGDISGSVPDGSRYFQYKAILVTPNQGATPSLQSVEATWTPQVSIHDHGAPVPRAFCLLPVSPNPCSGAPSIEFGLPGTGCVEILLFDISGRLVAATGPVEHQPGWHEIQLGDLSPGVYFVRMRAEEYEASERFVVLE